MSPKKILIVAGEPSGDLHASKLVGDLKDLNKNLEFFGIGGELSKEAGVDIVSDISKLAVVGVVEVIKNIFTVGKIYGALLRKIDSTRPDLAILVDYPGFNLRLAGELKRRNIPVIYYISPQVWAWGKDRIAIIKRCVKKVVVFFKFEEELYKDRGVDVEFVGHPLLDTAGKSRPEEETKKRYGLVDGKKVIAVLPGSRATEIRSLLPVSAEACALIKERMGNTQFIIAKYAGLPMGFYDEALRSSKIDIKIADGDTYNVLSVADFAIVASGTATLETAIMGKPFVLIYRANPITYLLYRLVATVKFLGLVNIIASKQIVPELLQSEATAGRIADKVIEIVADGDKYKRMAEELSLVKSSLGPSGASRRAAQAILPFLK